MATLRLSVTRILERADPFMPLVMSLSTGIIGSIPWQAMVMFTVWLQVKDAERLLAFQGGCRRRSPVC